MLIAANIRKSLYPSAVFIAGVHFDTMKLKNHWEALAVARPKCRVRVGKMSETYTHLSTGAQPLTRQRKHVW